MMLKKAFLWGGTNPSGLSFSDLNCNLMAISRQPRAITREVRKVVKLARMFNENIVRPETLAMDRKIHQDPDYLPWEWVQAANRHGFYTMWIPKMFGGKGYSFSSLAYFLEEISSCCLGMANLIGVHYLGFATLIATWNLALTRRLSAGVIQGEKTDNPCLLDFAITEPGIGTDTSETDLVDKGSPACHAARENGGYRVNGTKIFISNGHFSTWHIVLGYEDVDNPSDTFLFFAVRKDADGFFLGRKERKMGQKACPASELIFRDCFVPDDLVCVDRNQTKNLARSHREIYQIIFDSLCSSSKAGVCAFGAGVARGVYEAVLRFAFDTKINGSLMANLEWVQCRLADMLKNVLVARLLYAEVNFANGMFGLNKMLQFKPLYYVFRYLPARIVSAMSAPLSRYALFQRIVRKMQFDWKKRDELERTTGWASVAKFTGSDLAVENCRIGLSLMGHAGSRHENNVEKFFRDAKLLQIYEGTNQLNRLEVFKNLIGRNRHDINMFDDK
jgi:alkylation response protein AidB-like acyl-CoA dehydrogenase